MTMHEELARAAHIQIPSPRPYKVVKSKGCLLGVLSSFLYRAAVTTVTAAHLVGGVEVADVVREVWGEDGGDALLAWRLEKESDAHRHLRHQVNRYTDIYRYGPIWRRNLMLIREGI
jgi:hypothetical protein